MSEFTSLPLQIAGAVGGSSMLSGDIFQLGSVVFDEVGLEVPESLGSAGGHQALEQHDFPGGIRTHQTFGAFPDPIEWKGYFSGASAFSRMQQVDLIRVAGNEVLLRFGPKAWLGRVASFSPVPHHRWLIAYSVRFMPRVDISQAVPAQPAPTPEAPLAGPVSSLTTLSGGIPFPMPPTLVIPVGGLLTAVSVSMAAANGIVASISATAARAIQTAATAVAMAAAPILALAPPLASYMALASSARAETIAGITNYPVTGAVTSLSLINPNFPLLAAQYLRDATRWGEIADFNGMSDPLPIGSFTIQIPNTDSSQGPTPA